MVNQLESRDEHKFSSRVLFPLRSNLDWFRNPENALLLEARIKHAVLLFDELCFEDGRYDVTVFENGSTGWFISPSDLKDSDRKIIYSAEGEKGSLKIQSDGKARLLAGGTVVFDSQVDFKPILEKYDLFRRPFVELQEFNTPAEVRPFVERIRKQFKLPGIGKEYFQHTRLIRELSYSCIQAALLETPFIVSQSFHALLITQAKAPIASYKQESLMENLLSMKFPNFSELPWDEVIDLRNEASMRLLRRKLSDLAKSKVPVHKMIAEIENELLQDVKKLRSSKVEAWSSIVLDIMGFIPLISKVAGLVSLISDASKMRQDISGWSMILLTLDKYRGKI